MEVEREFCREHQRSGWKGRAEANPLAKDVERDLNASVRGCGTGGGRINGPQRGYVNCSDRSLNI